MNRVAVAVAAAAALMLAGAGVATAQDPEPEPACAEALAAFNDARAAHIAALDADKAAADAEAADEALARAENALANAQEAALSGGVPGENQAEADATRLRAKAKQLESIPVDQRSTEQQARLDQVRDRLELIEAVLSARAALAAAEEDAGADALALQAVANETDAAALGEARQAAGVKAEEICGADVPDDPADPAGPVDVLDCVDFGNRAAAQAKLDEDRTDPNGLDVDGDGLACENIEYEDGVPGAPPAVDNSGAQVPVIPDEAPNTGGGPALM